MLEKNKVYETVITDYTAEGQGVARIEGCAVFVPNVRSRDEHDSDLDKVKKAKEKYEKMVFFCEKYKMPYMVVDTSNLTPDQTVELIMKRIEGRA